MADDRIPLSILFLVCLFFIFYFQTISAFSTWLEDEIDVSLDVVAGTQGAVHKVGLMAEDLNEARLGAFAAYKDFASIDVTVFGLELYLQYSVQGLAPEMVSQAVGATAANGASSFLEVEAATKSKSKFWTAALLAPYVIGGDMANYLAVYEGYQKYAQYNAAVAGYQSSVLKAAALKKGGDETYSKAVKGAWYQFATFQQQAAYIDYITSAWMLYAIFFQPAQAH